LLNLGLYATKMQFERLAALLQDPLLVNLLKAPLDKPYGIWYALGRRPT